MSFNDPIADMLTRIRNAALRGHPTVSVRRSKICTGIAAVLLQEGYINSYDPIDDGKGGLIRIELKYEADGHRAIRALRRISKPGCRVYRSVDELPRPLDGLGIAIVSTSSGILSDRTAREKKVGGELLCTVE